MNEQTESSEKVILDAEILPETMSTLKTVGETYHISIGEVLDYLVSFYARGALHIGKADLLTELADVLSSEHYKL